MPPSVYSKPSEAPKKPSLSESVNDLISRKKQESTHEGRQAVRQSAEGVQHEVSEVMAGMEVPKEGLSEKNEKKGDGDLKAGGQSAMSDDGTQSAGSEDWGSIQLPGEEVMVRKVRTAIQLQIKIEWKRAKRLSGGVTAGGAQEYSESISRIRRLKSLLSNLIEATFDYVKELYKKYFHPSGKRRDVAEVEID